MGDRASTNMTQLANDLLRLKLKYKQPNSQVLCQHRMRYHIMPELPYHPPELPLVRNQKSNTTPDHAHGRRNLVE